jgi:hypothetical protein
VGRYILIAGAVLVLIGLVVTLAEKFGLPIGRLPGDIVYKGRNTTVYIPVVTCILLSLVLTLVGWLFRR